MKPLNLPKESQEALLNGASMFIIPCKLIKTPMTRKGKHLGFITYNEESKYKIGDEVYIQEEQDIEDDMLFNPYGESTELTENVIIYKATIKDVKVVRVHELSDSILVSLDKDLMNSLVYMESKGLKHDFRIWYNEQYGNYNENPYVFLYGVERI